MIVVTGATGNVGRELVRELAARNAEFRVLVRDPARAVGLPERAERVVGNLDDPATLGAAFDGADALFLLVPGIGLDHAVAAVAAARAAGIGHIVQLSSFHAAIDPMPAMGRWHHEREQVVAGSGIPVTVLRPGGYMTNALEWAPVIRAGGEVLDPTGPGRYAPIDPADIAAVAAAALIEPGHQGRVYHLTGTETCTIAEQVATISRVIGADIKIREAATPEQALQSRYPGGAPPALAAAIIEWFSMMRADTIGFRTDTVRQLLGRDPVSFEQWCVRNIDAFRAPEAVGAC
ncbi:NAD(P)H-binding protein [Nocardia sp. NBC_00565]|uniref:SDR family oxidoreductase n=1 Tax=Nocardia sp. NBC_00565 TaxID=2975993 RepID=UPI002E81174F|nr:NAD(P)H-binding protein [Nocardia sp. NBC_00565]WUC07354.1 NAD(P)H-binding protein [Nocardia sp. NBC_00565]